MKKFILLLACLIYAENAFSAEDIINKDVQNSLAQTQVEIEKSVAEMDAAMQKVMPEIARSMSETINGIFASFTPLLSSLEENKVFSKTSAQMNQDLKSALNNIEQEVGSASLTAPAQKETTNSETFNIKENFLLTGSKTENGKSLEFIISQNKDSIKETATLLDKKASPQNNDEIINIKDFNGHSLPLSEFKIENIDGQNFLIYSNDTIGTFALGNYNKIINIKLQTTGIDSYARAQSFLRNLKQNYLK